MLKDNLMNTLDELRNFQFEGYDEGNVKATKENIAEFVSDANEVWKLWLEGGLKWHEEFKVDFDFYSKDEKGVNLFSQLLTNNGFEVDIKKKRFLLFFKSYEVRASLSDFWNLIKLKERIEQLGLLARKYNLLIEGYGGLVKE